MRAAPRSEGVAVKGQKEEIGKWIWFLPPELLPGFNSRTSQSFFANGYFLMQKAVGLKRNQSQ